MRLDAFVLDGHRVDIRPAPVERDWMDASNQRFAYRCLPLNIANTHGWEILCGSGFSASWNGSPAFDAISVVADEGTVAPAISHFGEGVLTFHVPCLFRTEPGFDLMVQGPVNRPKDAISGLSGIVETDWSPYSFTMNWQFTRPDTVVRFEAGEPFCHFYPIRRADLESVETKQQKLSANPELKQQHEAWIASRARFNAELKQPGSDAQAEQWQRLYTRGALPSGEPAKTEHRTRLRLNPFAPGP